MLKKSLFCLFCVAVTSQMSIAKQDELKDSVSVWQSEKLELAKAILIGAATGSVSGYFSANDPDEGIHFGNFFWEKVVRGGLNDVSLSKNGYEFYSWVASWGGWTSVMLWRSTFKHTLAVGVPTLIAGLIFKGPPSAKTADQ